MKTEIDWRPWPETRPKRPGTYLVAEDKIHTWTAGFTLYSGVWQWEYIQRSFRFWAPVPRGYKEPHETNVPE